MAEVDLVIRGGSIVDGTGVNKAYIGDVAIKDGKICALSKGESLNVSAAREIDAKGRIVSPGWVDVHTHLDAQMTWDPLMAPFTTNGVTTAIMGNCGVGFAPVAKEQRTFVMELMEGVEDIPFGCMSAGLQWNWETFPEFMDYLDSKSFGCDLATFVGHGAVRAYVLGEKANVSDLPGGPEKEPVTSAEIAKIADVVQNAIEAGAIGFSTSRTLLHRDKHGILVPGTLAAEEELLAIGKAVALGGGGVMEMATDFMSFDDIPHVPENHVERLEHFGREWIWISQISKGFGIPVSVCLGIPSIMVDGVDENGFRMVFRNVEEANADGADIKLQVFTRPQGIQLCWNARSHPFMEAPTFFNLLVDALKKNETIDVNMLKNPEVKSKIIKETIQLLETDAEDDANFGLVLPTSTDEAEDLFAGNFNQSVNGKGALARFFANGYEYIFKWTKEYEPKRTDSVAEEAKRRNCHPMEVIYDWLCEEDGKQVVSFLFMNYHKFSLEDTTEMLLHKDSIPGLGDAGAHAGFIVDSTSHTFLLTHYVRDRTSGPRVPIETAIKLHTKDTAHYFGMYDRGTIEVGMKADINIINLDTLECKRPEFVFDLPKGAGRWIQESVGYDYTILSGEVVHEHGVASGKLPGRLVRNPNRGNGLPTGYKYNGLTGKMSMWLTNAKLETKQLAMRALLRVLGPDNVMAIGSYLAQTPLDSHMGNANL